MKFNTLFVATICAGTLLSSCVNKTAQERQLKYTQATLIDGDAFAAIQIVGEKIQAGAQYAQHAEASGDEKSQEVAGKVKAYYAQLIPELDRIAIISQMDFPIKGIPAIEETRDATEENTSDSTAVVEDITKVHKETDYVQHAQHEVAEIKKQLTRLARNTNKDLRNFAKTQLPAVNELYTTIGGKEEEHAHH